MGTKPLASAAVICTICIAGCGSRSQLAGDRSSGDSECRTKPMYTLTGQVAGIVVLDRYEGVVVPAATDPSYVVVVSGIRDVSGIAPPLNEGRLAFAVHSPTKLFAAPADQVIGRWYEFTARTSVPSREGVPIILEAREVGGRCP